MGKPQGYVLVYRNSLAGKATYLRKLVGIYDYHCIICRCLFSLYSFKGLSSTLLFDKSLLLVISFFSLDEVSAKCEDLGLFGRIMMVKPFEAAFNSIERINSQKTILTRKIR
jgi:hypothetical protein